MSVATTLQRGRAAAERLMVDACTISRAGAGEPVLNEDTLQYETPAGSTVYTGKCRVQVGATMASTPEAGERVQVVQRATIQLPMTVTDVAVDDVVTVTSSKHDP